MFPKKKNVPEDPTCWLSVASVFSREKVHWDLHQHVVVIRELITDHNVGKQSTSKKRQLASTDVLACTRSLKTLSRDIPILSVVVLTAPLRKTSNSVFAGDSLTLTSGLNFSVICPSLGAKTPLQLVKYTYA